MPAFHSQDHAGHAAGILVAPHCPAGPRRRMRCWWQSFGDMAPTKAPAVWKVAKWRFESRVVSGYGYSLELSSRGRKQATIQVTFENVDLLHDPADLASSRPCPNPLISVSSDNGVLVQRTGSAPKRCRDAHVGPQQPAGPLRGPGQPPIEKLALEDSIQFRSRRKT